jgi:2-desacetyl-2-hydroxyethyl bacteriochlorophyllide A dehydrogenase
MALDKARLQNGFKILKCEKHFHDHDESWIILAGRGTGYWIDHDGRREEFLLETGDIWMIPAGFEHGSDGFAETGSNSADFTITIGWGTMPIGCHEPGHYYVEKEGYIPRLVLEKMPTERYRKPANLPAKRAAVVFTAKGETALQQEEMPVAGRGQVLCRMKFSGLTNGTERNVLMGGNYGGKWPNRIGYQNVGEVVAIGAGVKDYAVGDIIFSGSSYGHVGYFAFGATSEVGIDPYVVRLPPTFPLPAGALLGMASVALHDVRRANVRLGEKVLVVGAGGIGLFTAQAAKAAGARVTICDVDDSRLAMASSLGVDHSINAQDDSGWKAIKDQGPYDVVIEDSGAPVLDRIVGAKSCAEGVIRHRGKLVLVAGRQRVDYSFNAGQGTEIEILQGSHFEKSDIEEVVRLALEGRIQFKPLVKEIVPYGQAVGVYDRLRDTPGSMLGVVFDWSAHP